MVQWLVGRKKESDICDLVHVRRSTSPSFMLQQAQCGAEASSTVLEAGVGGVGGEGGGGGVELRGIAEGRSNPYVRL